MTKNKLFLMLVPLALAMVIMGASYGVTLATGARSTGVVVQNLGNQPATVRLDYYNQSGGLVAYTQTTIQPASAIGFSAGGQTGLTDGFVGSLVVSADQNIAAIGNDTDSDSVGFFSAVSDGATTVYLPALYKGFGNWQSEIWIQATETVPPGAVATVTFKDRAGQQTGTTKSVNLTTYATIKISPADYSDIASGWAGGAVINSSYKMAVVVKNVRSTTVGAIAEMYNGFSGGASTVYVPAIYRKYGTWDSNGINVQNLSATTATVKIDFYNRTGTKLGTYTFPNSFAANGGVQAINTNGVSFLPDNYAGTAVVYSEGGQDIIAIVDVTSVAQGKGNAYNAVLASDGAQTVYLPSQYKRFGGWRSGVVAMNIGGGDTTVTLEFYARGSATPTAVVSGTVGQYISYAQNTTGTDLSSLPDGWSGTVVVKSDRQNVVVVGNVDGGFTSNAGKAGMYNAFPKP